MKIIAGVECNLRVGLGQRVVNVGRHADRTHQSSKESSERENIYLFIVTCLRLSLQEYHISTSAVSVTARQCRLSNMTADINGRQCVCVIRR